MGNIQVTPRLERQVYMPGNAVQGEVELKTGADVNVYGVRVHVIGEMYQRWTSGSGKHRSTHVVRTPISKTVITVFGGAENETPKREYEIKEGTHKFPFAFQLSPSTLPSADVFGGSTLKVQYYVAVVADVARGFDGQGCFPFTVLSPMPYQQWSTPTPKMGSDNVPIFCCCCCERGTVAVSAQVDRTNIALDRDKIAWVVRVDATKSKDSIDEVIVSLVAVTKPKVGATSHAPSESKFMMRVPCSIKAGQEGEVSGTLDTGKLVAPTIESNIVDITYFIRVTSDAGGCCVTDPVLNIPVVVAHTVDESQQQWSQQMQQSWQNFRPPNPEQLNQPGMYEVPNLYYHQQAQQQQPNYEVNHAPGMPPPPPTGYAMPGFTAPPPNYYADARMAESAQ